MAGLRRESLEWCRGNAGFWGQNALDCDTTSGAIRRDVGAIFGLYGNGWWCGSPNIAKGAPFIVLFFARRASPLARLTTALHDFQKLFGRFGMLNARSNSFCVFPESSSSLGAASIGVVS
jgi:hypothetical protein